VGRVLIVGTGTNKVADNKGKAAKNFNVLISFLFSKVIQVSLAREKICGKDHSHSLFKTKIESNMLKIQEGQIASQNAVV